MVADTTPLPAPALEQETAPAEILLSDPLQVFGALGGPNPTAPITVDHLARAYALFLEAYPDEAGNGKIRDAARRANELTADRSRWSVQEDGTVQLIGSAGDTYRVSDDLCKGPSWYNRRSRQSTDICKGSIRAGSSMCYHTIARELLRLAQALYTYEQGQSEQEPQVETTIAGDTLLAMFGFYKIVSPDSGELLFQLGENQVVLMDGAHFVSCPAEIVGQASLLIPPVSFASLWPEIRQHAKDAGPVQIRVGRDQIEFRGGPLDVSAPVALA